MLLWSLFALGSMYVTVAQVAASVDERITQSRIGGPFGGFNYLATSSAYGNAAVTSCGGILSAKQIRKETGYIPIAAAQSMMEPFIVNEKEQTCSSSNCEGGPIDISTGRCALDQTCEISKSIGGYCDISDCKCKQVGTCACGRGTAATGTNGTAPLGCFKCAVGRFLETAALGNGSAGHPASMCSASTHPMRYNDTIDPHDVELHFVVIDTCPNAPNAKWCPARDGETNQCGVHNHFDIAMEYEDLQSNYGWDANYIVFSLIDCPANVDAALQKQISWQCIYPPPPQDCPSLCKMLPNFLRCRSRWCGDCPGCRMEPDGELWS